MKIPVLSYHSISNKICPMSLSTNEFEKHLIYLKNNNYKSINFDEINSLQKKQCIITFDDGYKDLIINALPLLKKYDFKAICYIVANKIGKSNDWDFKNNSILKKELMSILDIQEWLNNGMSIGSHSFDHLDLTNLSDKDIKFQLSKSKFFLEDLLSKKIKSFCYPYGKYNKDIILEVKKEYINAVSTNRSRYNPRKHSEFLIPRIDMGKKLSSIKLYLKIQTIYEDIKYNEI